MIEILTGFETTYMPADDTDVAETSGHIHKRRSDLELVRASGVRTLRYPVRWHRVEERCGHYDWSETDEVLDLLEELGLEPIVDLVHHTSYPRWLRRGFADPEFPGAFLRYVEAFARRYPRVRQYTLFNEPFATLLLCGHEAAWPPHGEGIESFVHMLANVLPAVALASQMYRELLPEGRHVWVDTCEHHTGSGRDGRRYAAYANDRRFFVLDALLGRIDTDERRPFVDDVVRHSGSTLMDLSGHVDVVGLDYYAHCQWHFGPRGGIAPSPRVAPFADLIGEYAARYERPCMVTETNIRGTASDRATWFKYLLEQCETAVLRGIDLRGLCWFPFIDSCDWDTLLRHCRRSVDPVGVVSVNESDWTRQITTTTYTFAIAAQGAPSSALPAYELQQPMATWLRGYLPHMRHWTWQPPPPIDVVEWDQTPGDDFEPLGACR
jgi:beta-glucosidase/6-phospho-beta-glucosidase/beta-galactosidase